jgi:ribonuclease Z
MNLKWKCAVLMAAAIVFASPAVSADDEFYAILIGTGMPLPNPERASAATLIVAGGTTFLIDTGRGSLSRLVEAGYRDVSMVAFTHFHADHFADFGELMLSRSINGAKTPLTVHGPKGTQAFVDDFLKLYEHDHQHRIEHHGEHWYPEGMQANVTEFEPGVILDQDGLRVTMFDVDHEPIKPAVGYRIDYGGKAIVVSGDTRKTPVMVEMSRGADLLIHEAMNGPLLERIATGMRTANPRQAAMLDDLMDYHTTAVEVAEIAAEAGVKKVALTHLVPSIPPAEGPERAFIQGMDAVFSGEIIVGRDLMKIEP